MSAKRLAAAAVAAFAAATLVTGAGATTEGLSALRLLRGADVERYLVSIGVEPGSVVVQRGRRNYAGSRCPGKKWNCTSAQRVVQLSAHGDNSFECTPAAGGTDAHANRCVIVQVSSTGTNSAVCRMEHTGPAVTQVCDVTQTNEVGANLATVQLVARARGGTTQEGTQVVDVVQSNGSGRNNLHSVQRIDQTTSSTAGGIQSQEGHQSLVARQTSQAGDNGAHVVQHQLSTATALTRGALVQRQNEHDAGPNARAEITQESSSGHNSSLLDQQTKLDLEARSAHGPVEQRQGSPSGGLSGSVDQHSSQRSTSTNTQDEAFDAHADAPAGALTQVQFGPMECCTTQLGNSGNLFEIDQQSTLVSDGGTQASAITGRCTTSGGCTISQLQRTDTETLHSGASCTGSVESPCTASTAIICIPEEGCRAGPPGDGATPASPARRLRS